MITNLQKKAPLPHKRRIASEKECRIDLQLHLPRIFEAFTVAYQAFESEIRQTNPMARPRGFEAALLNAKIIQSIQEFFPDNWAFGKYKRFTLRVEGYTILFKKLNKKGEPMNIKTKAVTNISNQLSLSLFDNTSFVFEPILFFGYKKNKIGIISEPQLIYIDENQIKWKITDENISTNSIIPFNREEEDLVKPTLKRKSVKKASGQ